MDEGPFEVSVDVVDGWLTVIRLSGDGCLVRSDEVEPMRQAIDDGHNRWFLIDASELTWGCDHLAGLIALTSGRSRQRAGWTQMVCTGMVRRLVEVSSGGAVPVCDTVEEARGAIELMRDQVEAGRSSESRSPQWES